MEAINQHQQYGDADRLTVWTSEGVGAATAKGSTTGWMDGSHVYKDQNEVDSVAASILGSATKPGSALVPRKRVLTSQQLEDVAAGEVEAMREVASLRRGIMTCGLVLEDYSSEAASAYCRGKDADPQPAVLMVEEDDND